MHPVIITLIILLIIPLIDCVDKIPLSPDKLYAPIPSESNPALNDEDLSSNDVIEIMAISDTHNIWTKQVDIEQIKSVDIVIHAGDMTMVGDLNEIKETAEWINKFVNIHKKAKYAIIISGNHDLTLHEPYYDEKGYKNYYVKDKQNATLCQEQLLNIDNVYYLKDFTVNLFGISFYGSPWTPDDIGNWVLITHGPPNQIGDIVEKHNEIFSVGDHALWREIKKYKPQYHIFGHIHEGYAAYKRPDVDTVFINAAMLTEKYRKINFRASTDHILYQREYQC